MRASVLVCVSVCLFAYVLGCLRVHVRAYVRACVRRACAHPFIRARSMRHVRFAYTKNINYEGNNCRQLSPVVKTNDRPCGHCENNNSTIMASSVHWTTMGAVAISRGGAKWHYIMFLFREHIKQHLYLSIRSSLRNNPMSVDHRSQTNRFSPAV